MDSRKQDEDAAEMEIQPNIQGSSSSTVAAAVQSSPSVVQYGFTNYAVEKSSSRHTAKCKYCSSTICEKIGTTSSFTR